MKTITFITFLAFILVGCKNSQTKEQKKVVQEASAVANESRSPLDQACETAYKKEESLYELIRVAVVKEHIIKEYSRKFYNKLVKNIHVAGPIKYTDGIYTASGTGGRTGTGSAEFTYSPSKNQLTIHFMSGGEIVQPDGEIHYNTEGWELRYNKDEFDEDIKSEPLACYRIVADYNLVPYDHIRIIIGTGAMILSTHDFKYSRANIAKILIKDHDSGKVYNVAFDETYHKNSGASMRHNDIGVLMRWKNISEFVNIVTNLTNYSIAFINEYDENIVVKNPENLKNIHDAIKKFIINNTGE